MAYSLTSAVTSGPVHSLDEVRTKPAKAELKSPSASIATGLVLKDALARHYGSLKAAAISLDYDPSQLSRDLERGTFNVRKLDRCDDDAKAFIVAALYEAFGEYDPKARMQRLIREARQKMDELDAVAEAL